MCRKFIKRHKYNDDNAQFNPKNYALLYETQENLHLVEISFYLAVCDCVSDINNLLLNDTWNRINEYT